MDFFEHQDRARKKSKLLVFYLILAVAGTILLLDSGLGLLGYYSSDGTTRLWDWQRLGYVSVFVLTVVLLGSLYKTFQLRGGGGTLAQQLGGRLLNPQTEDLAERKLLNVVEEMSLASGTPMPEVYVLDREQGINAFAAGHTTKDMAIGVTRGCMEKLSRDELQGVIAHEFSHILHGDMGFNLRLIGIVHGILVLTLIGRVLLEISSRSRVSSSSDNKKGGNPLPLLGLLLIIVGWIGVLAARLIKSAISRQREFLADASAVQYTRNPEGIAGALKKIAKWSYGSRLATPMAEEASHMFFGNGLAPSFSQLFATHPPILERIKTIEPTFDGNLEAVPDEPQQKQQPQPALNKSQKDFLRLLGATSIADSQLQQAQTTRASLSVEIERMCHSPSGSCALLYALLLSNDEEICSRQTEFLKGNLEPAVLAEFLSIQSALNQIPQDQKLVLAELAASGLRRISQSQYQQLKYRVETLVQEDSHVSIFEYAIQKVLFHQLDIFFNLRIAYQAQTSKIEEMPDACGIVLSTLAYAGETDPKQAYQAGSNQLGNLPPLLSKDQCALDALDKAFESLALLLPEERKRFLQASANTVMADSHCSGDEKSLLCAIAHALDCPMPVMA